MALIGRISRLFTADVHAVLDQLEEPKLVLRQAIREMEEELVRQQQLRQRLATELEAASARIAGSDERVTDLDGKLDISFANGNDAIARKLTRKKLETARLRDRFEARRQGLAKRLEELDALIESNADRLDGMRQKSELLGADDEPDGDGADTCTGHIDDDDVEIAFLREKQSRTSS